MAAHPIDAAAAADDQKVDILLVDDRPDKLLALESILGELGQNMVRAYSGREALRALLQQDFAVILLDVNMPGMDGFETAEMIRTRERSQRTPIIFFTAMDLDEKQVFRSYSLGAVDFIKTPVVPEILKAKVAVFVDLFKKTEQVKLQAEQVRLLQEREHASKMAEAADRLDAEAKRNRFFTLALDMLGIADMTGTLRQLNPSWGKTLGFSDDELKSRSFLEFVHPDDRAKTEEQLAKLAKGEAIPYFENRFATKAGGYRWLAWTAAPYIEEGLLYMYARDLSETRRAEEERVKLIREQTARAAAEASERRTAFLAEAATALAASLDYAETLAKLAHLAVPALGDWAYIDVAEEQGAVHRLEVAHADEGKKDLAEELKRNPPSPEGHGPQSEVIRCGQPTLIEDLSATDLDTLVDDAHQRELLTGHGRALDDGRPPAGPRPVPGRADRGLRAVRPPLRPRRPRPRRRARAPRRPRRRQRAPVPRVAGGAQRGGEGEPGQGRVPGHPFPRAADPAHADPRLDGDAAIRQPRPALDPARAGGHRAQRARPDPAHRRPARRLAHHHRQAAPRGAADRPRAGRRGGRGRGAVLRGGEGDQARPRPSPRSAAGAGRSRSPAAGGVEPGQQRGEVHPAARTDRGAPRQGGLPRLPPGARLREGDHPRVPALRLRPLPPGRQHEHALARRPRARPGHRAPPGRAPRRHRRRRQRRRREGGGVHRQPSPHGALGGRRRPAAPAAEPPRRSAWTACGCWSWRTRTTCATS